MLSLEDPSAWLILEANSTLYYAAGFLTTNAITTLSLMFYTYKSRYLRFPNTRMDFWKLKVILTLTSADVPLKMNLTVHTGKNEALLASHRL